jgi:hypothetical protein
LRRPKTAIKGGSAPEEEEEEEEEGAGAGGGGGGQEEGEEEEEEGIFTQYTISSKNEGYTSFYFIFSFAT